MARSPFSDGLLALEDRGARGIAICTLLYGASQFSLQLVGGHLADRVDPRRMLLVVESIMTAATVTLAFAFSAGMHGFGLLAGMQVVMGALSAFDSPARNQLVARLVPRHELVHAQGLINLGNNVGMFVGPAVGGVLLYYHDLAAVFWINAASFIPALLILLTLKPTAAPTAIIHKPLLHSVGEGMRYVAEQSTVRSLILTALVSMGLGMPYQVLLPVIARDVAHMSAGGFATLTSAAGVGAFLGVSASVMFTSNRYPGRVLVVSALGFAITLVLFSMARDVHTLVPTLVLASGMGTLTLTLDSSLLQAVTPDGYRGRVSSISFLTKGVAALTSGAAGFVVHEIGAPTVVAVMAMMMVPLVVLSARPALCLGPVGSASTDPQEHCERP